MSRREQIVDATLRLLAEAPPHEVTTRAVAKRVGVSQPALFKHFAGREALFQAVVQQVNQRLSQRARPVLEVQRGLDACLGVASELLAFAECHPGLPRLLLMDVSSGGQGSTHSKLGALVAQQQQVLAWLLEEDGSLPHQLDASTAAHALVRIIQGTLLSWLHAGRATSPRSLAEPGIAQWHFAVRAGVPADTGALPKRRCHDTLDLRRLLEADEEPLMRILGRYAQLAPGGCLRLQAPFVPRPLRGLLSRHEARVDCRQQSDGSFEVSIIKPQTNRRKEVPPK